MIQYDKTITDEQKEHLQIISRSGLHLRDLINDVLEMSKIEANRMLLDEDQFVLEELLNDLKSMFGLRARQKELAFRLESPANLPRSIFVDEGKLRQILINLVGNAIKFTNAGHVTIRVATLDGDCPPVNTRLQADNVVDDTVIIEAPAGKRQWFTFAVEDSGPGISAEDMQQLFSPFFQSNETRTQVQGTGLGLAISRKYAQLMGGDLTVESQFGLGATFRLKLPVTVIEQNEDEERDDDELRVVGLAPGQPPYRVLVAEDFADSRALLVRLLQTIGFEVRGVENGKACVEQWHAWHPHLIWMDIRMPEMNGYEATRYIKSSENGHKTVIIALTASAFAEERKEILAAGCDDFVRKPFRDVDIFEHIAKHLDVRYIYQ
ncbi:MAG: response regulator [Blastochloris sp.]|nr:response regulator [Blastochloris sp.]